MALRSNNHWCLLPRVKAKKNTKFRVLLRILRYLFDDVLTTQHSLIAERQMAVTSLLTLQQKPDTSAVRRESTVSFLRRNLLSV